MELLLTDTDGWDDVDLGGLPPAQAWRHAEARLLAQRVAELVERGAAAPEDVVVLLRAVGSLPVFERALQDVGLPTLAVGGRGYWGRQVVRDLCGWLAILANPRDEIALYGVPGLAARRGCRPMPWPSSGRPPPPGRGTRGRRSPRRSSRGGHGADPPASAADDRERLRAFAVRFQAERAVASRLGLDELIERIVAAAGYDLHVLVAAQRRAAAGQRAQAPAARRRATSASTAATSGRSSTSRTPSSRRRRARRTRPSSWGTSRRCGS